MGGIHSQVRSLPAPRYDHMARYGLTTPLAADYADLSTTADTTMAALATGPTMLAGAMYFTAADQASAKNAGVWRDVSADFPNSGDEYAYISLIGWRRTNIKATTNSPDFFAAGGIMGRVTHAGTRFGGGGAVYQAQGEGTCQVKMVAATGTMATPAGLGGSLDSQHTTALVINVIKRIDALDNCEIDTWVARPGEEPMYIERYATFDLVSAPALIYFMHLNVNAHDGEMFVYGERGLSTALLTSEFGITRP